MGVVMCLKMLAFNTKDWGDEFWLMIIGCQHMYSSGIFRVPRRAETLKVLQKVNFYLFNNRQATHNR